MPNFDGFVGEAYQAPSIYQDAQELINWYPEIDKAKPQGARGVMALYPTPGLTVQLVPGVVGEVRGLYVLAGGATMLAVVGNTAYSISASFVATVIGTLTTNVGLVYITDNRVAAMFGDGVNRYSYTFSGSVWATLPSTDGAFTGADKVEYVDDFIVYNNPGTQQWGATSALLTTSPALSFSSKDSAPDNIVNIAVDKREVLLIGEYTTERWINVGAFPFPFNRIPGASMQHGCAAKYSVARLGESMAWISQDRHGAKMVIQMEGYQPKRISTHAVENDIFSGVVSDARAFAYQQDGHEFYELTFPTQNKTWVYDLASDMWHKRFYRNSSNGLERSRANCQAWFQGLNLVGDYANGTIYVLDRNAYTDAGQAILRLRRAPHVTQELDYVFHESFQVQFQPGVGDSTTLNPQCMLRWSDDGGSTWSNMYNLPIGKIGEYKNRAIKKMLGRARDRVYEVSITDPVYAAIISANLDIKKGIY